MGPRAVLCATVAAAAISGAVGLGIAAPAARAGTWYIHPLIRNDTESTDESACPGHPGWTGCVTLQASAIESGEWITDRYGPTGGRHELPASGGGNLDEPSFDAPHFDEGADGYFVYGMPGESAKYGLAVVDNEEGVGDPSVAYPACAAAPGATAGYACLAKYPHGTNGEPENSQFEPEFSFTPLRDAQFTAAGQVCAVPGSEAVLCTGEGGGWSPPDTEEFMLLTF